MRKIIVFLFVFFIFLCSFKYKNNDAYKDETEIKDIIVDSGVKQENKVIKISYNNEISNINLEDYVFGVVACEMPLSFEDEALKAMSVAARTFALYKINTNEDYVMKTSTSDQCYLSNDKLKTRWGNSYEKNYKKLKSIIEETNNQYMTYNDEIIISFYFSISNGYTESCENVFSQKLDYLVSVDSSWDKNYNYKEKSKSMSVSEFLSLLNISDKSIKTIDIDRSSTGRVSYVYVNGNKYKGTKFRSLLSLRSTDFDINYDSKSVSITTRGYGHGVGMSQYGANYMAKSGYKYDEILKYYYNGIKIVNK